MRLPKLSPRRWFWLLTMLAFAWGWLGRSAVPGAETNPFLYRFQSYIGTNLVTPLAIPGITIFGLFQNQWASAVRVVSTPAGKESVAELKARIAELEGELNDRDSRLLRYQENGPEDFSAKAKLKAYIRGRGVGTGSDIVALDRGSADGVTVGMPVVAQNSALIGRVYAVSRVACWVQLITDPRMKTQAVLVRRTTAGALVLNNEPCLVSGMGGGMLKCDTLTVQDVSTQPMAGDLVELADPAWFPSVRYKELGVVENVRPKDTQMLRYDLQIVPGENVSAIQTAWIILKEKD